MSDSKAMIMVWVFSKALQSHTAGTQCILNCKAESYIFQSPILASYRGTMLVIKIPVPPPVNACRQSMFLLQLDTHRFSQLPAKYPGS